MKKLILTFIDDIKSNKKLLSFDIASTKQAIVMRLLSFIGWDIFNVDEVIPDQTIKSKQVDYVLQCKGKQKIFISVKMPKEELEPYQKPILELAKSKKIDLTILTNGIAWWFYLSNLDEEIENQKFCTLNMLQDDPDEVSDRLKEFLGKSAIANGDAVKAAKDILYTQKQKAANKTIPQAWNKILTESSHLLIELISEKTESLSGTSAEKDIINKFVSDNIENWMISDDEQEKPTESPVVTEDKIKKVVEEKSPTKPEDEPQEIPKENISKKAKSKSKNYSGETIASFVFKGNTYYVDSWDELLMTLCDIFVTKHKDDFDKVLWLSGENRSYFSNIESELRHPEKIKRTNIFVEQRLNPNETVSTALNLLSAFGYSSKDLSITLNK